MKRAQKALPLLAILFLGTLSNGQRFGHVAKRKPQEHARGSNPQPRLCLR